MKIYCEIIFKGKHNKGHMFTKKGFTIEKLLAWAERNCKPAKDIVVIDANTVKATYPYREEIYTLVKIS